MDLQTLKKLAGVDADAGSMGENISINPYQYTWMNSFAKFYDINKKFEIDYFKFKTVAGSNLVPNQLCLTSRCGPVDLPVEPTVPIISPCFTSCPFLT